jgi:hypothetical protein
VRAKGLEPPYLAASDPKSDASTNFATPACYFLLYLAIGALLNVAIFTLLLKAVQM